MSESNEELSESFFIQYNNAKKVVSSALFEKKI